jgi:hypothetical protein
VPRERTRAREPVVAVARQRARDHVADERRHVGPDLADVRDRIVRDRLERQELGLALEQVPLRERLPQHRAERPDVGAPVERLVAQLLGRHVRVRALHGAGARLARRVLDLRDAEVEHLHDTVDRDEQVLRRHVAMHDAEQLAGRVLQLVRVVEALARLHAETCDEPRVGRERVVVGAAKQRERDALKVLHRDVVLALPLAELEHLADVGVRDPRRDARLVEEHRDEQRIAREVREDPLDAHELLEAAVAVEARQKDLGHAAGRELRDKRVLPEASRLGGGRRHPGDYSPIQ